MSLTANHQDDSGQASAFDLVHADFLRFFTKLVTALGGEPLSLLRCAGIAGSAIAEGRPPTYTSRDQTDPCRD